MEVSGIARTASRKNILMLLPRWPFPPHQGDKIRAWSQVRFLGERHNVWLAALCDERPPMSHVARVRTQCREIALDYRPRLPRLWTGGRRLLSGKSINEGFFDSAVLRRAIGDWARTVEFDAALVFSSGMAVNLPAGAAKRTLCDMNDVDSRKWRCYAQSHVWPASIIFNTEARRLARWEKTCADRFDRIVLVNEREADALRNLAPRANTAIVRTGVPLPETVDDAVPRHPIVGFIGSMGYAPNVQAVRWFARWVWPHVHARRPDAQWLIVGRNPARCVSRLSSIPGVVVTGDVDSVEPFLKRIRVFVVPMQSAIGVQTKLIEAMAHGKAAVVSPQVAGGFDAAEEQPFLVADDSHDFVRHVSRLLDHNVEVHRLSQRGRRFVANAYDETAQLEHLERLLLPEAVQPTDGAAQMAEALVRA